jgi:hypothetical protein
VRSNVYQHFPLLPKIVPRQFSLEKKGGRPSTILYDPGLEDNLWRTGRPQAQIASGEYPGLEDYLWRIVWRREAQMAAKIAMENSESDDEYDDLPDLESIPNEEAL